MSSRSTQSDFVFLSRRLDEIRMSQGDRLRAKAQLARAEAIADLLVAGGKAIGRLVRKLIVRPLRRAVSLG